MSFRPIPSPGEPEPEGDWPDSLFDGYAPYEQVPIGHELDFWVDRDGDIFITEDGERKGTVITETKLKKLLGAEVSTR